jgi:hypothetical protein
MRQAASYAGVAFAFSQYDLKCQNLRDPVSATARAEVALVPLCEWRQRKQLEDVIHDGRIAASELLVLSDVP